MKKIMWIISLVCLAGTAMIMQFLPESIPMHYDFEGNIDRWGSRYESIVFPLVILAFSLFWTILIGYYEKKALKTSDEKESAGAKSNAKVLAITGISMAAIFTVMQAFSLYGAYTAAVSNATRQVVDIGRVSIFLIGIIMVVLGNFMTKTRINSAVGFRISWSMYNENTWRKSNRFAAFAIMTAGVLTIITAALVNTSMAATFAMLGYLLAATIVSLIYAHKVYTDEISAEKS
ncbi:MAG: SdpI family protein [Lachnospiraceae bacterium]|nr:SdpI family protein [Lachnospiraceae bacterium]